MQREFVAAREAFAELLLEAGFIATAVIARYRQQRDGHPRYIVNGTQHPQARVPCCRGRIVQNDGDARTAGRIDRRRRIRFVRRVHASDVCDGGHIVSPSSSTPISVSTPNSGTFFMPALSITVDAATRRASLA
jgi:hypothetical protein